jgi:hypothetical protein
LAKKRLNDCVSECGQLTTTFASSYKARVTLEQALTREAALAFNARATGSKYLIVPHG